MIEGEDECGRKFYEGVRERKSRWGRRMGNSGLCHGE